MTNRVSSPPQDFQKMCKHAEREQESKKLAVLMERVKRQIAQRSAGLNKQVEEAEKVLRLPSRSIPLER